MTFRCPPTEAGEGPEFYNKQLGYRSLKFKECHDHEKVKIENHFQYIIKYKYILKWYPIWCRNKFYWTISLWAVYIEGNNQIYSKENVWASTKVYKKRMPRPKCFLRIGVWGWVFFRGTHIWGDGITYKMNIFIINWWILREEK